MTKWRHFVIRQFGVQTDNIFWHTFRVFWHPCRISKFQNFKIGWFRKTKSKISADFVRRNQKNVLVKKKWFSIQTLANHDYVGRNVMFRPTKLRKWMSHTKGYKNWFRHTKPVLKQNKMSESNHRTEFNQWVAIPLSVSTRWNTLFLLYKNFNNYARTSKQKFPVRVKS